MDKEAQEIAKSWYESYFKEVQNARDPKLILDIEIAYSTDELKKVLQVRRAKLIGQSDKDRAFMLSVMSGLPNLSTSKVEFRDETNDYVMVISDQKWVVSIFFRVKNHQLVLTREIDWN